MLFRTFDHSHSAMWDALLDGKSVSHIKWAEQEFAFMQRASEVPVEVIPKMSSLPDNAKAEFLRRNRPLTYTSQFCRVDGSNRLVGWIPPEDDGRRDWVIIHDETPVPMAAPVSETAGKAKVL